MAKEQSKQKSKSWIWIIVVIVILGLAIWYFQDTSSHTSLGDDNQEKGQEQNSEVVATVNGKEISMATLNKEYNLLPPELRLAYTKELVLNATILQTLLLEQAEKEGISVSQDEVSGVVTDMLVNQFGALNISEEEFFKELESRGINQEEARDMLRKQFLIDKLYAQVLSEQVLVSEEDASTFYEENKAQFTLEEELRMVSHILVEDKEKAQEILNELKQSSDVATDFARLATEHSIDQLSAVNGGNLGFASRGMFVPAFEEAAFSLDIGEVSGIVETEFGFHILFLQDIQEKGALSFEEVKQDIIAVLQQEKDELFIQAFTEGLLDSATIEIYYTEDSSAEEQRDE